MKAWFEALAGLALVAAWVAVSAAADRATGMNGAPVAQPPALVQAPRPAEKAASDPRSGSRLVEAG
jgi:hypothetical protein